MLVVSCISINRHPSNSQSDHQQRRFQVKYTPCFGCFDFRMITSNPAEPPKTRSNSEQPRKEPKQTIKKHRPKPGRHPEHHPRPLPGSKIQNHSNPRSQGKKKKGKKHPKGNPVISPRPPRSVTPRRPPLATRPPLIGPRLLPRDS